MTLRERKKARTRERLMEEALRLFEAQGYESTTVDQITEAAEVARRTFFRYFPSKEAVVFPHRERRLAAFRAALAAGGGAGSGPALASVERALQALAEDYAAHRDEVVARQRIVERSAALLAYEFEDDRQWEAAIAEALGDRPRAAAAARRRARLAAGAVMGTIRATLREWYAAEGRTNLQRLGEEAFALLAAGLAAEDEGDAP